MAARLGANTEFTLQFDKDRNKQCHYYGNTFYYSAGLKTHLEHAHKNIISMKGINDPESTSVKGLNNEDTNLLVAVLGSNCDSAPSGAKDTSNADDIVSSIAALGTNSDATEPKSNAANDINNADTNPSIAVLGTNTDIAPEPEPKSVLSTSTQIIDRSNTSNTVLNTNVSSSDTSKINYDIAKTCHKWKVKPSGKHYQPTPTSVSTTKPKAESTKPCFITVTHGLRKVKKHQKFHCKLCQHMADSQAIANKHYRDTHPPVSCLECKMLFTNPSSLRLHKYMHLDKKYSCRNCNKFFPFESDLACHRLKHHRHPGFQCNHSQNGSVCGKWYFAKSDLAKHVCTHSGKVYGCYECDYTTIDIHYLRVHRYTHSDKLKYMCKSCKETFKHHTQMRRHKEKCKDKSRI